VVPLDPSLGGIVNLSKSLAVVVEFDQWSLLPSATQRFRESRRLTDCVVLSSPNRSTSRRSTPTDNFYFSWDAMLRRIALQRNPLSKSLLRRSIPVLMKPSKPKSTRVEGLSGQVAKPGEEVFVIDGADAPTALPADADESRIDFADPARTSVQSPAMWLGARGYRIDRLLGRGGYGEVYLADHPKLPRQVAIKVPRVDVVLTAEFKRRFLDEANIVAQLEHPNVVTIHDMIADPYPAIIYEYCGGGTLQEFKQANGDPIDEPTAIKLFALVADALAFAHNRPQSRRAAS